MASGISIRGGRGFISASRKTCKIIGDDQPFDPAPWIAAAPQLIATQNGGKPGARIVLWGADHLRTRLPAGGTLLAWDKHVGRGSDDSFADCEWAWSGRKVKREVFRHLWKGVMASKRGEDRCQKFTRLHVSQKPVELMRWCIDKARPLADLPVLDPYMGSGTTAIAALSLGMPFIGCEIDPDHYKTACQRIAKYLETTSIA